MSPATGTSPGPAAVGRVPRRRERTRAALVAAGLTEFLGRGPGAVSVETLLARADVSRATFYQFFASKYRLLEYILNPVYEDIEGRLAALAAVADGDVPAALIDAWIAAHAAHGDALKLLARLEHTGVAALDARRAALEAEHVAVLGRAERADVLRNGSARYSARLLLAVVAPLLETYAGHPGADALLRDALRSLLERAR